MNVMERVAELKIVPVVKLDKVEQAEPLCRALCAGGLPVAEITFRTACAADAIAAARRAFPEMLVGAGTVTNLQQAHRALACGAQFLVTPGFNREIVEFAKQNDVPVLPGVCTPTEVMMAMEYELPVVKFFPAGQYGGLAAIKALSGPFPALRFMPTGGVNADNVQDYLRSPKVVACGGSWMVPAAKIDAGDYDAIEALTRQAVQLAAQA